MRLRPRRRSAERLDARVIHQVAAWCLGYPDEQLFDRLELMRAALDEQGAGDGAGALRQFLDAASTLGRVDLAQHYTDVFDLSRKQTLYLSYWSAGDTRQRGAVLAGFKQLYRDSGFLVDLHGELPDHLPIVLEYAALADPVAGTQTLADNRAALELIRFALLEADSPYVDVLAAVCATLPGQSPPDKASAIAMAGPQLPIETVGLDSYGSLMPVGSPADGSHRPVLLPLFTNDGEKAFR